MICNKFAGLRSVDLLSNEYVMMMMINQSINQSIKWWTMNPAQIHKEGQDHFNGGMWHRQFALDITTLVTSGFLKALLLAKLSSFLADFHQIWNKNVLKIWNTEFICEETSFVNQISNFHIHTIFRHTFYNQSKCTKLRDQASLLFMMPVLKVFTVLNRAYVLQK